MSALSAHPDRTLSLCWEQHCKLLPGVQGISATQVAAWTVEEVRAILLSPIYLWLRQKVEQSTISHSSSCSVQQVFGFVQNLTGCEEQACVFKEEVRVN